MSGERVARTANPPQKNGPIKELAVEKLTDAILEGTVVPGNGRRLVNFLCEDCAVLPFDDFKVYKTSEYSAFSHLRENRDRNELHVATLMESFQTDGYLFTIIIVNEKIEIIDGQHRFEAAKRLHLPVYFMVMPHWEIHQVAVLNVNSRNWTMEDFMNAHAKGGNNHYVVFKTFYEQHEFNITTAQMIIFGRRSKGPTRDDEFRSGKMITEADQMKESYKKARKITELKQFHPKGWTAGNFVEVMLQLFLTKGYDHGHLLEQFKKNPNFMLLRANSLRVPEYKELLVDTYNHRTKDKIKMA